MNDPDSPAQSPHRGRMLSADAALAATLAASIVLFTDDAAAAQGSGPPGALGYSLLLAAAVAVAVRRLVPVATFTVAVAATISYFAAGYPLGPGVYPVLVATYTMASRMPLARSAALCGASVAAFAAVVLVTWALVPPAGAGRSVIWVVSWAGWLLLPWAVGALVRSHRDQVVREKRATARARDEDLRRHAAEERLLVARDLHDSVGHNLAVIAMQAGVALHVLEQRPDHARRALEAIRAQSKDGLDSLRSALDVFRAPAGHELRRVAGQGESRLPAPGLEQLDALVELTRDAGLQVTVHSTGEPVPLPAVVDHAAYRIVQEALTNTLRHGDSDRVLVRLCYDDSALELAVVDDERWTRAVTTAARSAIGSGAFVAGHGITGMRERALAVGGSFSADRGLDGFAVTARLPYASGTQAGSS